MKEPIAFTVEVDTGSEAERAMARWLRTWRRRGVHVRDAKYLHQGASRRFELVGPAEALRELQAVGAAAQVE